MNSTNCWKLFSGDIEGWIADQCGRAYIDKQTAHWMMNYGYYDIVSNKLRKKEIDVVNIADEKAIRFRLNRKEEKPNPYDGVCDLTNKEAQQIKNALKTKYVALSGGIGDHRADLKDKMLPRSKGLEDETSVIGKQDRSIEKSSKRSILD